jgi:hypothetical protein
MDISTLVHRNPIYKFTLTPSSHIRNYAPQTTPPEPENTKRLNPDNPSNQLLQLNADALRRRLLGAMSLHGRRSRRPAPDHESFYSAERGAPRRALATAQGLRL